MNVSWEDNSLEEDSEPKSPSHESRKSVAFMGRSNVFSMQGLSDKESNSDEDLDLHDFSDNKQDLEAEHRRVLQDSILMSKINEKRALKLTTMESQYSFMK